MTADNPSSSRPSRAKLPDDPSRTFNPRRDDVIADSWTRSINEDPHPTPATMMEGKGLRADTMPEEHRPLGADSYSRRTMAGRGGFGEVWRALQPSLSRTIALKRLRADLIEDPANDSAAVDYYLSSFRQEALTTASLEHPNIVPVYDYGTDDEGRPVMAMKFVHGTPWDKLIWADADVDAAEFLPRHVEILISVAQAVAFAHSRGIVHRDIKPSQVMVGEYGEALLMDWGLALVFDIELARRENPSLFEAAGIQTTETGANPAGTVAFMAPEQTEDNSHRVGPRTDVFLLGGTLYYLLTRTPPHPSLDPEEAYAQARIGSVQDPRVRTPDRLIPTELAELAMASLHPDPHRRVPSAKDFVQALRDYLAGAGKRLESMRLVDEARRSVSRKERGYTEMAACISLVERAQAMWKENPDAAALREELLRDYAESALRHGDLELARIQAAALHDPTSKLRLMAAIEAAERRQRFQRVLIRAAFATTLAMLLVVSLLAVRLNLSANRALMAQDEANKSASHAARSKADAEELVSFMAEDLYESLAPLSRLDLLDRVATRAQSYYESLDKESGKLSLYDVRNRARLLVNIGEIRLGQGRLDAARDAFEKAVAMARRLNDVDGATVGDRRLLADALLDHGRALLISSNVPKGEAILGEALREFARADDPESEDGAASVAVAEIHSLVSGIRYARGDIAGALASEGESLRILQEAAVREKDSPRALRDLAGTHASIADLLLSQGQYQLALGTIDRGLAIIERARNAGRQDVLQSAVQARLLNLQAQAAGSLGERIRAERSNQSAIDMLRLISGGDPTNAEFRGALSAATLLRAQLLFDKGDREGSDTLAAAAMRSAEELVRDEPSNIVHQGQLVRAYLFAALRQFEGGRAGEAADTLEKALRIANYQLHSDPTLLVWENVRATILLESGIARFDLGEIESARTCFEEAFRVFSAGHEKDPDNRQFAVSKARALVGLARCARANGDAGDGEGFLADARDTLDELEYVGEKAPLEVVAARAELLLMSGKVVEARPFVERLRVEGGLGRILRSEARKAGLELP